MVLLVALAGIPRAPELHIEQFDAERVASTQKKGMRSVDPIPLILAKLDFTDCRVVLSAPAPSYVVD